MPPGGCQSRRSAWKRCGSPSSHTVMYLRNGNAITSAIPKSSPSRWSRPSSSASNRSSAAVTRVPSSSTRVRSGSGPSSSAASRFGGRFQTWLNQSTKTSASARRAGSCGQSGGSGCRSSRWRRIAGESGSTRSPSTNTGTSDCPEMRLDLGPVVVGNRDPLRLEALVRERERHALHVRRVRRRIDPEHASDATCQATASPFVTMSATARSASSTSSSLSPGSRSKTQPVRISSSAP